MTLSAVGKIKLHAKNLCSKDCYALAKYFHERAGILQKKESVSRIIDLGVGGRVVYAVYNRKFNVTGEVGSILTIRKKRKSDQMLLSVKFDNPVWSRQVSRTSNEFYDWWKAIPQEEKKKINEELIGWKHGYWNRLQKYYEKVTGKPSKFTETQQGHILVNISPMQLRPATEKEIENAKLTKSTNERLGKALDYLNKVV